MKPSWFPSHPCRRLHNRRAQPEFSAENYREEVLSSNLTSKVRLTLLVLSFMATAHGNIKGTLLDDVARRPGRSVRFSQKQIALARTAGWLVDFQLTIPTKRTTGAARTSGA